MRICRYRDRDGHGHMRVWLSGAARSLDLGATVDADHERPRDALADATALYADWQAVGDSLRQAMDHVSQERLADDAARRLSLSGRDPAGVGRPGVASSAAQRAASLRLAGVRR